MITNIAPVTASALETFNSFLSGLELICADKASAQRSVTSLLPNTANLGGRIITLYSGIFRSAVRRKMRELRASFRSLGIAATSFLDASTSQRIDVFTIHPSTSLKVHVCQVDKIKHLYSLLVVVEVSAPLSSENEVKKFAEVANLDMSSLTALVEKLNNYSSVNTSSEKFIPLSAEVAPSVSSVQ